MKYVLFFMFCLRRRSFNRSIKENKKILFVKYLRPTFAFNYYNQKKQIKDG